MQEFYIPRTLDAPHRIVIWTVGEFTSFILPALLLFFAYDAPVSAVFCGFICLMGYKQLHTRFGPQFLLCLLLWNVPAMSFFKKLPSFNRRCFVGL